MYEKLPLLGDTEACEYKAKNQSDPNTRQYLAAANEIYQIAEIDKAYFMDVKDVSSTPSMILFPPENDGNID